MSSRKAPVPELVEELLDFPRPSGVLLRGALLQVRGSAGSNAGSSTPAPVVVMLHGLLSNRDHNFAPELAKAIAIATGHAVYRFDFRFAPDELEPTFRYRFPGFADDLSDLEAVLSGLQAMKYDPWCLIGHSRGANDVLLYAGGARAVGGAAACAPSWFEEADTAAPVAAAGDPPPGLLPRAFVALAARRNMPAMFERLTTPEQRAALDEGGSCCWATKRGDLVITAADAAVVGARPAAAPDRTSAPSAQAVWEANMAGAAARISADTPFLLLHGTEDEVIPVADAQEFSELDNKAIDLRVVEGARHAFLGKKPLRYVLSVVPEWVVAAAARVGVPTAPPS